MISLRQVSMAVDHSESDLQGTAARKLGVSSAELKSLSVFKRTIDARKGRVRLIYNLDIELEGDLEIEVLKREEGNELVSLQASKSWQPTTSTVSQSKRADRPIVVGMGPCGLFAALLLARAGAKPIILERGKIAGDRARDVTGFWRRGAEFNSESNVQYGEGGAGTFSDGKLYTRVKDPEKRIPWLLSEMEQFGAPKEILSHSRPHIGTDRLITMLRNIRAEILDLGGEIHFSARVDGLLKKEGRVVGVRVTNTGSLDSSGGSEREFLANFVILALGHSARDSFEMLQNERVAMEGKSFSVGVRIEHSQEQIDKTQYGKWAGHAALGAAPYKFVGHCEGGNSAYSFCMCPGGLVVAAGSEAGGVVTNGMSSYARAESNANSGFMVEMTPAEMGSDRDPLAAMRYQRQWEQKAFEMGGGSYFAPAQRLGDFLEGKASQGEGGLLPSYQPGVVWSDLRECLPEKVWQTLQKSVPIIARKLKGFDNSEAVLTGVETRSSSPIRLLRDSKTLQSTFLAGLYPAGEGAGYAGGIVSAALDGIRVAEAVCGSDSF